MSFLDGSQRHTVIATRTKKKAYEMLGVSAKYFNDYFCETGNAKELELCLNKPETFFIEIGAFTGTYYEFKG